MNFQLRPPPVLDTNAKSFIVSLCTAGTLSMLIVYQLQGYSLSRLQIALFLVAVLFLIILWISVRAITRGKEPVQILAEQDDVLLPVRADSHKHVRVSYKDVVSLGIIRMRSRTRALLIATNKRHFVYPLGAFSNLMEAKELECFLEAKILGGESGTKASQRLKAFSKMTAKYEAKKPVAVTCGVIAFAIVFAIEANRNAQNQPLVLFDMGALVPIMPIVDQWMSLLGASFLHTSVIHLFFNALLFFSIGAIIEKSHGSLRVVTVAFVSSVAGWLTSWAFSPFAVSVGASGMVSGLIGYLLAVHLWRHQDLPVNAKQPMYWWSLVLVAMVCAPIFIAGIDFACHAGGFVAGVTLGFLTLQLRLLDRADSDRPADWELILGGSAVVLLIVTTIMLVWSTIFQLRDRDDFIDILMKDIEAYSEMLNGIAWGYVTSPDSSAREIATGLQIANAVVSTYPRVEHYLDTLGAAHYRVGNYWTALEHIALALEINSHPEVVSHFVQYHARALRDGNNGSWADNPGPKRAAVEIKVKSSLASDPQVIKVRATNDALLRGRIYAYVLLPDGAAGLLRIYFDDAPVQCDDCEKVSQEVNFTEEFPEDTRFIPVLQAPPHTKSDKAPTRALYLPLSHRDTDVVRRLASERHLDYPRQLQRVR